MEASNKMVGQLLHRPSQRSTDSAASSSMALERMESIKQRQQKERQNAATAQQQRFFSILILSIICCFHLLLFSFKKLYFTYVHICVLKSYGLQFLL
jgi:hypothetical protein